MFYSFCFRPTIETINQVNDVKFPQLFLNEERVQCKLRAEVCKRKSVQGHDHALALKKYECNVRLHNVNCKHIMGKNHKTAFS